jgi:hypothetical protein
VKKPFRAPVSFTSGLFPLHCPELWTSSTHTYIHAYLSSGGCAEPVEPATPRGPPSAEWGFLLCMAMLCKRDATGFGVRRDEKMGKL